MKKLLAQLMMACAAIVIPPQVFANEHASPDDAIAFVKEARTFIKKNGKEKALEEFNNLKGKFVKGEMYIVVAGLDGVVQAHGSNARLIGKNLYDIKDADGKSFVQEQIKVANTKGSGWVDFRAVNPVSKSLEMKSVYLEKVDDYIVSSGIYKGK